MYKFPYRWNLSDGYPAKGIDPNGLKVFGTFVCGGGSTMGYKLAGFDHLGGVEIDPKMASVYVANHSPKYMYNEDIRVFNERTGLPDELYNLDILDGSPPCSTFSMAGSRESAWGKEKVFREGQEKQTLDDLVFVYCETIKKLRPKVFILENVKGIIQGNAKAYSRKIAETMTEAGYVVQVFCLDASTMGVPQRRERVFFIGRRKDCMGELPNLILKFDEKGIVFGEIEDVGDTAENLTPDQLKWWALCKQGDSFASVHPEDQWFGAHKLTRMQICNTIISSEGGGSYMYHPTVARKLNNNEHVLAGTFPIDYTFQENKPKYIVGMSVPPVMTAQIAHQIYLQWFKHK